MKKFLLFAALFVACITYSQPNAGNIDKEFLSCNYQAVIALAETKSNINTDETRKLAYSYKMMGEYEKSRSGLPKTGSRNPRQIR